MHATCMADSCSRAGSKQEQGAEHGVALAQEPLQLARTSNLKVRICRGEEAHEGADVVHDAGNGADDERGPGVNDGAGAGDSHQASQHAVAEGHQVVVAVACRQKQRRRQVSIKVPGQRRNVVTVQKMAGGSQKVMSSHHA